jgi:hypothetical protein
MVQLRLGPSGPLISGDAPGDVLIWDGTEWQPGPVSGSSPLAVRSQFQNDQALNPEIVADIEGAAATFTNVPAGAFIFVQCVLNFEGFGDSFAGPRVVYNDGSGETIIWEPGPVLWPAQGENPTFAKLPLQFQTEPLAAPAASVTVKVQANGASSVLSGHLQAELIQP